ncbi:hypothetical protein [Sinimarinibacterium flocculans]|uniref:hypothetical protein n=1 Tax=Sinimarinibacterium flocculans TaxID=985250 RepID=UPI002491BA2E|nr:hypothetical protein [Sinimarinibacterium flocculans]
MAKGLSNFFEKPDDTVPDAPAATPLPETPASGNDIADKPGTRVIEEGTPGQPGHNILYLQEDEQPVALDPEAGAVLHAPAITPGPEGDTRYEGFASDVGTAGDTPYIHTNDLTPPTQDSGENLAARENIVPQNERVSEASELELRGQVHDLTGQLTTFDLKIQETQPALDAAIEAAARANSDRAALLLERARVVDAITDIEKQLNSTGVAAPNDPENPTTSTTPTAVVEDDHRVPVT